MDRLKEANRGPETEGVLEFMLNGGMGAKIDEAGGKFKGISLRQKKVDVLLVVRADFDGQAMVAFVGASSMGQAVVKLEEQLFSGIVKWRVDRFV